MKSECTNLFAIATAKSLAELRKEAEPHSVARMHLEEGTRDLTAYEAKGYMMQHIERLEELLTVEIAIWHRSETLGGQRLPGPFNLGPLYKGHMDLLERKLAATKRARKRKTDRRRLSYLLN